MSAAHNQPTRPSNLVQARYVRYPLMLWLVSVWLSCATAATTDGYSFGVLPYLVPKTIAEMYGPATMDISARLGRPVALKTASSFQRFREHLQRQTYDLAVIQPFDYPLVVEEMGYIPLAQVKVQLRAVVVVKKDTPHKELADLRGRRIALAPRHAATSRQGMWALKEAGLQPGSDVSVDFQGSHDACLHALLVDSADACITGPPPFSDFVDRTGANFRIVAETAPIPHVLAVAHPRVPATDRETIARVMSEWDATDNGRKLLAQMRFPAWVPARPEQYAVMRRYLDQEAVQPAEGVQRSGLVFGSFPYFAPRVMAEQFAPMVKAFTDTVGRPVHFRTTPSFERFQENLGQSQYDIALIRPYDYTLAVAGGYAPVARLSNPLGASFYVRSDSPYRHLADLQGQVVALPPSTAVINILGRSHLKKTGISVIPAVRPGHDSCMQYMLSGKAAACVTTAITIQAMGYEPGVDFRVLDRTAEVPNVLFVLHKRHSEALRQRLSTLIVGWNESAAGQDIMRLTGLGPFTLVNIRDYEALTRQ